MSGENISFPLYGLDRRAICWDRTPRPVLFVAPNYGHWYTPFATRCSSLFLNNEPPTQITEDTENHNTKKCSPHIYLLEIATPDEKGIVRVHVLYIYRDIGDTCTLFYLSTYIPQMGPRLIPRRLKNQNFLCPLI